MRKAVEPVEDMTVLLSLHDVSPAFENDVVRTCDSLVDLGISSLTLLVTPFYEMKKSNSFVRESLFNEYLLSLDFEISLHGYTHFTKSGAMNEYASLTAEKAKTRLEAGYNQIRSSFGKAPIGFVPPLWDAPPRIIKLAKETGFKYGVYDTNIHQFSDSSVFSSAANIISQGKRFVDTESAIFEIELGGSLQIAIHPSDYRMNDIFELLTDLKDQRDYRFLGYRDFLTERK